MRPVSPRVLQLVIILGVWAVSIALAVAARQGWLTPASPDAAYGLLLLVATWFASPLFLTVSLVALPVALLCYHQESKAKLA